MTINLTYVILWMVFGLIVGSIAHFISPSTSGGILALMFLGIVGAVVGGYLGELFFGVGVTGFNVISFILAVAGSLIVIFVYFLFGGK
jgi:uncharacterized membrane protein YeaQ/YmgE (transglycosylase-associated protein family)